MKIIKEGNLEKLNKTKRFACEYCGCIFEANITEYKLGVDHNETYAYAKCPTCSNTANEERMEQRYGF